MLVFVVGAAISVFALSGGARAQESFSFSPGGDSQAIIIQHCFEELGYDLDSDEDRIFDEVAEQPGACSFQRMSHISPARLYKERGGSPIFDIGECYFRIDEDFSSPRFDSWSLGDSNDDFYMIERLRGVTSAWLLPREKYDLTHHMFATFAALEGGRLQRYYHGRFHSVGYEGPRRSPARSSVDRDWRHMNSTASSTSSPCAGFINATVSLYRYQDFYQSFPENTDALDGRLRNSIAVIIQKYDPERNIHISYWLTLEADWFTPNQEDQIGSAIVRALIQIGLLRILR